MRKSKLEAQNTTIMSVGKEQVGGKRLYFKFWQNYDVGSSLLGIARIYGQTMVKSPLFF